MPVKVFRPLSAWCNRTGAAARADISPRSVICAAIFFVNVVIWNIRALDFNRWEKYYPRDYNYILQLVGLDQAWGMFSPYPVNWDGWYQISGVTLSGQTVNLTPGAEPGDPISDDRPTNIASMYKTERWRKYLMSIADNHYAPWRPMFAAALIKRWSSKHKNDPLKYIDVYYFLELTMKDGGSTRPEKKLVIHWDAPPGPIAATN